MTSNNMSKLINSDMKQKLEPRPSRTWLSGNKNTGRSIILTLPTEIAHAYDLHEPTNILITPTNRGILISKLKLELPK